MTILPRAHFYYLRHGQTDWNVRGIAQGSQDIPLNDHGRLQAREAAKSAVGLEITRIVSSPLSRALETAMIVGEAIGLEPSVEPSLREAGWGEMEGVAEREWLPDWQAGRITINGGETFDAFCKRAAHAVTDILDEHGPALIVAHGGTYWGVQRALGLDLYDIPNATIVEHQPCDDAPDGWRITLR